MENYTSIGIFEWDVTLWGDVHVLNTVDTLSTLPPRVALANHLAWGQAIFKLHIGTNTLQFTGNLKTGTGKPIFNHTIFPIPIVKHGSKWYLFDDANWKKTKKRPAETLRLSNDMSLHDLQETGISLSASDASMIQRMTSSSAVASSSVPASSSESQSHSLTIEFPSTILYSHDDKKSKKCKLSDSSDPVPNGMVPMIADFAWSQYVPPSRFAGDFLRSAAARAGRAFCKAGTS